MNYTYESISGKTINVGSYIVPDNGLQLNYAARDLDEHLGTTLNRYINGVLNNNVSVDDEAATIEPGVLYVNTGSPANGSGAGHSPFNTLQAAINAASNNYTIYITTAGTHLENIVMRDLDGIAIIGDSEMNTIISNNGPSHTFSWVPGVTSGALVNSFNLRNITFENDDTTNTYHAVHIDAAAVLYPNTFLGHEADFNVVDIEGTQPANGVTAYFRNTGAIYLDHSQITGGDLKIDTVSVFRTRNVEVGTLDDPRDINITYEGSTDIHNGLGRGDVSIATGSVVFGDINLIGHPILQLDHTSLVVGDIVGLSLTSFYASGRDYAPLLSIYGQVGLAGGGQGNITLTFPDVSASNTAINAVDLSNAHIQGTVTLTKASPLPADARGYAYVIAPAQFDKTTSGAITSNGYISLDLRGAVYSQAALTVTGAGVVDRNHWVIPAATTTSTSQSITITPPFPPGATYSVVATPATAIAHGVNTKTVSSFTYVLASGGTTTDFTLHRY